MTGYRAYWEIDVEADSPQEAAAEAHRLVRKPDTKATVYEVIQHDTSERVKVDLTELAESGVIPMPVPIGDASQSRDVERSFQHPKNGAEQNYISNDGAQYPSHANIASVIPDDKFKPVGPICPVGQALSPNSVNSAVYFEAEREGKQKAAPPPVSSVEASGVDWFQTSLKVIREHKRVYQVERDDLKQRGKANAHLYAALMNVCDSIEISLVTLRSDDTASPVSRESTKHSVKILWGQCREDDAEPQTYTFDTAAELTAFMDGVEAMDGWMAYEIIDEDTD